MGTREGVLIPTGRETTQRDMNQFPLLLHAHESEERVMVIQTIIVITPVLSHRQYDELLPWKDVIRGWKMIIFFNIFPSA